MASHSFDIRDAEKYGIEKAILLQNLRFWLDKEIANSSRDGEDSGPKIKKHSDGNVYVWTYNSSTAFAKLFPYMKAKSIGRWLKELEDDGVIFSGNFNKSKYDRTKWYSMPEFCIPQNGESKTQNGESKSQNGESKTQNGQPIPDINTYINTDINTDDCDESLKNDSGTHEVDSLFGLVEDPIGFVSKPADSLNQDLVLPEANEDTISSEKPLNALLWDALCDSFGYEPKDITKALRGKLNAVVKDLKQVDATPEEIKVRAINYRKLHSDWPFTPTALAAHWAGCTDEHVNSMVSKATIDQAVSFHQKEQTLIDSFDRAALRVEQKMSQKQLEGDKK